MIRLAKMAKLAIILLDRASFIIRRRNHHTILQNINLLSLPLLLHSTQNIRRCQFLVHLLWIIKCIMADHTLSEPPSQKEKRSRSKFKKSRGACLTCKYISSIYRLAQHHTLLSSYLDYHDEQHWSVLLSGLKNRIMATTNCTMCTSDLYFPHFLFLQLQSSQQNFKGKLANSKLKNSTYKM